MEVICITAPGDGVAPAALLSVPTSARKALGKPKPAQYLFNVPEGLSRLALEHQFRPGAGLRAVCVTGTLPEASGGWGGLLMRLSQDGHGHVTLVGPPGIGEEVCIIASIVKWRHPAVNLETIQPPTAQGCNRPAATSNSNSNINTPPVVPPGCNLHIGFVPVTGGCCYEDDLVHVMALWSHEHGQWQMPEWLTQNSNSSQATDVHKPPANGVMGSKKTKDTTDSSDSSDSEDSSSEGSSSSSDSVSDNTTSDDSSSEDTDSSSSSADNSDSSSSASEDSDSSSSTSDNSDSSDSSSEDSSSDNAATRPSHDHSNDDKFDALDRMFLAAGQAGKEHPMQRISGMQGLVRGPTGKGAAGMLNGPNRQDILQALRQSSKPTSVAQQQPSIVVPKSRQDDNNKVDESGSSSIQRSQHARQGQQVVPAHASHQQSGARKLKPHTETVSSQAHKPASLLGYLCCERSSGQLLLVLALSDEASCSNVLSHPAVRALMTNSQLKQRMVMAGHLSPPHIVQHTVYQAMMRELPGKQVISAGKTCTASMLVTPTQPQQVTDQSAYQQEAGPRFPVASSLQDLGFHASARTIAKLHLLNKDIFPLPALASSLQPPRLQPTDISTVETQQQGCEEVLASQNGDMECSEEPVRKTTAATNDLSHGSDVIHGSLLTRVSVVNQQPDMSSTSDSSNKSAAAAGCQVVVEEYDKQLDLQTVWQDLLTGVQASQLRKTLKELHDAVKELCSISPAVQQTSVPLPQAFQPTGIMQYGQHGTGYNSTHTSSHAYVRPAVASRQQEHLNQYATAPASFRQTDECLTPASKRMRHNDSNHTIGQLPGSGGVQFDISKPAPAAPNNKSVAAHIRQRLRHKEEPKQPPESEQLTRAPGVPAEVNIDAGGLLAPGDSSQKPTSAVHTDHYPPAVPCSNTTQQTVDKAELQKAALLRHLKNEMQNTPSCLRTPESKDTRVVFLGTGSAEPSKYRGPSAILLQLPSRHGCIMMDCGEGTWGALLRSMGETAALQAVADLRCVFISHRHADHCLGLAGLLAVRPIGAVPLLVVGPYEVKPWLQHLNTAHGYKTTFVHCKHFHHPQAGQQHHVLGCGPQGCGFIQWLAVRVHHCHDAYGLVLVHKEGWKLVYSGDTRPCNELIQAGMGATLLIHEATFEPKLLDQALQKRHSTSSEALEVSTAMKAYRTILTHFSQRYSKLPAGLGLTADSEDEHDGSTQAPLQDKECSYGTDVDARPTASNTSIAMIGSMAASDSALEHKLRSAAIAFDGMNVSLSSLPWLPLLNPYISSVFQDAGQLVQPGPDS